MSNMSQALLDSGELQARAHRAQELLAHCQLCPRRCGVNRLEGELGFCETGKRASIASYGAHFGEERPLVGKYGSGTIFLASCNLRCCFCQNYDISHFPENSQEVGHTTLAAVMLELQSKGCHNINFVTPGHVAPQILEALVTAISEGLTIPLIYNCSGYESTETIELLDGVIDIYMPDFKFWNPANAQKYADAVDYPQITRQALIAMHHQVGDLIVDDRGLAVKGLLIRHLLMPGALEETKQILDFISSALSPATYVNIMDQYRPLGTIVEHPELGRPVNPEEYQQALAFAEQAGLTRLDERDFETMIKKLVV